MSLKAKRVLVTGACGFIGSHLVERLVEEGARVKAFVFYNSFNSWGWLENLSGNMLRKIEIVTGDVRDQQCVRSAVKGADTIFHLAALIGIPYSYSAPESYVATNVGGTLNILQAAREYGTRRIIVTSTSEVYGTALRVPIDESHPRQPQSPYAATKIAADALAESFYRSFSLPVTIVRPFNTYGPRQSARAIIPTIITQLLSGKKTIALGALHPTRDLVYVKDTVDGFVRIASCDGAIGTDVNIATGREISIRDLAGKIICLTEADARLTLERRRLRPSKSEVERLLGSSRKTKRITGWQPHYSLDRGLAETIAWFKDANNRALYKHDEYNV